MIPGQTAIWAHDWQRQETANVYHCTKCDLRVPMVVDAEPPRYGCVMPPDEGNKTMVRPGW